MSLWSPRWSPAQVTELESNYVTAYEIRACVPHKVTIGIRKNNQYNVYSSVKRLAGKQVIWKTHFYGNKLVAQEHTLNEAFISAPTSQ
jgi:hypothetical protein